MAREDTFTNYPEDAAAYEANRAWYPGARYDDAPSASELARDAYEDRQQAERERKAREAAMARGEYVPSAGMDLEVHSLDWTLSQSAGIRNAKITPVREGVLAIQFAETVSRAAVMTTLRGTYGDRMEFTEKDGTVWVRVLRRIGGGTFE